MMPAAEKLPLPLTTVQYTHQTQSGDIRRTECSQSSIMCGLQGKPGNEANKVDLD